MYNKGEVLLKYLGLPMRGKKYSKIVLFLLDKYGDDKKLDSFKEELSRKDKKFAIEFYYKLDKMINLASKRISEIEGSILRHPRDIDMVSLVDSSFECLMRRSLEQKILENFDITKEVLEKRYVEKRSINPEIFKKIGKTPIFYIFLYKNFLNRDYNNL